MMDQEDMDHMRRVLDEELARQAESLKIRQVLRRLKNGNLEAMQIEQVVTDNGLTVYVS